MDLYSYFRSVRRNWWLILLSLALTTGLAAWMVMRQTPVYRATTTVELRPSSLLDSPAQIIDAYNTLDKRSLINTTARKATSTSIQERVATKLNVPLEVFKDADVAAIVPPDTNLLEISASSTNAQLAAAITNSIAQELNTEIVERAMEIEIIDAARVPAVPFAPQPVRTITMAALFGLVIGLAIAAIDAILRRPRAIVDTAVEPQHTFIQPVYSASSRNDGQELSAVTHQKKTLY